MRATLIGTALLMTLTGCTQIANSRFNPLNWFGASTAAPVAAAATTSDVRPLVPQNRTPVVIDNRPLVTSISALTVERTTTGAIVRASGVAPTQGFFNAELVPQGITDGVLTLAFRAQAPAGFDAQGSALSRTIHAAYIMDRAELAAVRSVRVEAATNARVTRR